ncbi:unnamed protein product [Phyllotreta striolata]|uniref:Regulatory protein zeste n=1 Tax=Phyllotreta striolata TaxID=444603 RepID=A0A9N9XRQ6_PHYSR|nr:unnamed protein product [Phyllotreta striolata]
MEVVNSLKTESNETFFEEDGIQYSDFENVEYEGDDLSSFNLKNNHRKRTRNFTHNESNLICSILQEYLDIVDNKKTDQKTNYLKSKAWSEITRKFNDHTKDEERTPSQLKTFYDNYKRKRKRLMENGECIDSHNHFEKPSIDILTHQAKVFMSERSETLKKNYIDEYHKKRIQLVDKEIEKVKAATEQQHRLFLLQEEKLLLEIQEIKERLKNRSTN